MNNQVHAGHSRDHPPLYIPSEAVHWPERHRRQFRGRPRSILSSTAQTYHIACVHLGQTFSCPHRLAYVLYFSPAEPAPETYATSLISVDNAIPFPSSHAALRLLAVLTLPVFFDEAHGHKYHDIQNQGADLLRCANLNELDRDAPSLSSS